MISGVGYVAAWSIGTYWPVGGALRGPAYRMDKMNLLAWRMHCGEPVTSISNLQNPRVKKSCVIGRWTDTGTDRWSSIHIPFPDIRLWGTIRSNVSRQLPFPYAKRFCAHVSRSEKAAFTHITELVPTVKCLQPSASHCCTIQAQAECPEVISVFFGGFYVRCLIAQAAPIPWYYTMVQ